jgi:hypothetical protein
LNELRGRAVLAAAAGASVEAGDNARERPATTQARAGKGHFAD